MKDVMKGVDKQLDGKFVDGKWVTKTDVNYKNDKSQTGDWGNEYGPSKDVSAVKKKEEPLPNIGTRDQTEHVDGETETKDWRAEYKNNQTEAKYKKVGDTHYYDSASSFSTAAALVLAVQYFAQ